MDFLWDRLLLVGHQYLMNAFFINKKLMRIRSVNVNIRTTDWPIGTGTNKYTYCTCTVGWSDLAAFSRFSKTGTMLPISYIFMSPILKNR